jgi:hypothetical protein
MPVESAFENNSAAIKLMKRRLAKFETAEGRLKGLHYEPQANDVVITTTPKAGTSWMQQICHQLRSHGDMDFEEISAVVPWLELAHDQGQDLKAVQFGEQDGMPRFFKTHAWANHCPKFRKAIVVLRSPEDVLVSFYHFFEDWFFESGTVSMDAFAEEFWLARDIPTSKMQNASYFVHLISWYKRREEKGVLIVFFEDLINDLQGQVKRIAKFLSTSDISLDDGMTVQTAVRCSSFEFMKSHESQFDEHLSKLARNEACGMEKTAGMTRSKLTKGKVGSGVVLSDAIRQRIQQKWKEVVEPVTGCASYNDLRKQLTASRNNSDGRCI